DRGLRARHRGDPSLPAGSHRRVPGEMKSAPAGFELTVAAWLLLAACPLTVSEWRISQLSQITSYGIFAMSLAFLWGQTGLLCFGHAIFFGVGAYAMALITKGLLPGVGDSTVTGLLAATLLPGLERSPLGTALRAVRDNEQRTSYCGFDVSVYKTLSLALSGGVAGFAGGLFVTQFGFVSPALIGVPLSTEVLIWTALGGREVLLAAFLGALAVRSVESVLSEALGYYWLLALGVLFVASVAIFPRGLLGRLLTLPPPRRMAGPA